MSDWQDRAWNLAEHRPGPALDPMWALLRAGLLGGQVDGPHIAADASTAICPVCSGPTAVGRDMAERPTPCTACRARVIAAQVVDGDLGEWNRGAYVDGHRFRKCCCCEPVGHTADCLAVLRGWVVR